jgi:hypothetical protein
MVVVNSNFEPERELAAVVLRVAGEERARIAIKADAAPAVPFSFGVLPPSGDAQATVSLEAEALSPDDVPLACPARARVGFVAGEARLVQLELTRACGTAACACDESQTCRQGECVSAELDVRELPAIEPGRELEGRERLPSTTLPEPERPVCNMDNGAWSDVGRALTKNFDGALCPVMSEGIEWGSPTSSLEVNRKALSDYIARHLEVEHDVITLQVTWSADALRVLGWASLDDDDGLTLPTLEEALQLPMLQAAQQPLQLVLRDPSSQAWLQALPRLLLDSGIVQRCRPIYLTASGSASFGALRQLRESIRTQPRWSELWNLVHFSRRLTAGSADAARMELEEAVAQGFDRVAIDSLRVDFPFLRRQARAQNVLTHLYNATFVQQVADLCDGASGLESRLSAERSAEIKYFDELRFQLASARTLIDLDVSGLQPGAATIEYQGYPELTRTRELTLADTQPKLVTGDTQTQWGETDTVLRFSAASEQHLALHDATFNVERPELKYFAWPIQTWMVTARLPVRELPEGARQVLVSKLRGESGWALQYVNEGAGSVLQYLWYGRGRDDGVVSALKGSILVSSLPMQIESPLTIYLQNHRIAIWQKEQGVVPEADPSGYYQHVMVTNDAPITLGADPDGGGYFDGDIQTVKISTMYGGGKNFLMMADPNN